MLDYSNVIPWARCSSAILNNSTTWAGRGWGVGRIGDSALNPFSSATKFTVAKEPSGKGSL